MKNNIIQPVLLEKGSYGCIHKPSLICKGKKQVIDKLSKVTTKDIAEKELSEYNKVLDIDPLGKYHLKVPELCPVDMSIDANIKALNQCKLNNDTVIDYNSSDLHALIMEDGGNDLTKVIWSPSTCIDFFKSAVNLFEAIALYRSKGLIHFDIKPENVLYSRNKNDLGRLVIIDLGLMNSVNDYADGFSNSSFSIDEIFEHMPFEIKYLSKNNFNQLMVDIDNEDEFDDTLKLDMKNSGAISFFNKSMSKSYSNNSTKKKEIISNYLKNYTDGLGGLFSAIHLDDDIDMDTLEMSYNHLLESCLGSIDTYGLGYTLKYVLVICEKWIPNNDILIDLRVLFNSMIQSNFEERVSDIDALLNTYKSIINKLDILNNNIISNNSSTSKNKLKNSSRSKSNITHKRKRSSRDVIHPIISRRLKRKTRKILKK